MSDVNAHQKEDVHQKEEKKNVRKIRKKEERTSERRRLQSDRRHVTRLMYVYV